MLCNIPPSAKWISSILFPIAVLCVSRAEAQPHPQFEVATVKSSPPLAGDRIDINLGRVLNGTVTFTNASLSDCLKFAYGIVSDEQLQGPDWIKSKQVRFDIVAKAQPGTPRDQLMLMVQALLSERLKLVLHREQKQLSYLALTVGKNGPGMKDSKGQGGNPSQRGRIDAQQMTMPLLATLLSRFERQTVVDMTGLKGTYELQLVWSPDLGNQAGAEPASGPSLFAAVQEQLGLKLESRKGPLEVLVVDSAGKTPLEN